MRVLMVGGGPAGNGALQARPVTSWAEITTADLEGFLAGRARNRHQETHVLRRYFAWARQRRCVTGSCTPPGSWSAAAAAGG